MWIVIIIIPLLIWVDFHLFRFYYHLMFSDEEDFHNSIKYNFTPDIVSLFKGEYLKDRFAEFKLGVFIFLCIVTIALEVLLVNGVMGLF